MVGAVTVRVEVAELVIRRVSCQRAFKCGQAFKRCSMLISLSFKMAGAVSVRSEEIREGLRKAYASIQKQSLWAFALMLLRLDPEVKRLGGNDEVFSSDVER